MSRQFQNPKVVEMMMRIEDRCGKVSNKVEQIELRLMRLAYRAHEVIRTFSQVIGEVKPDLKKEWIKGRITD